MRVWNTESRVKEEITQKKDTPLLLYTCGPTVYNYAHIGNFRTYIVEDLLRRTLKFFGFAVVQVMNITDIDDKTIRGAIKEGISLSAFTSRYESAFFEDLKSLYIQPAEHYPRATAYIPQMIEMIEKLIQEGLAYSGLDGSIYYAIRKFPSYGRLSHLHLEDLQAGASERVSSDEYDKESASDFVLWKAYDPERDGTIFWQSPFGKGRPGWHIECSAMATALLGATVDIHMGGVDNMFPHHENEIAQSEGCSHQQFVRYWVHVEHLLVEHKKMSKSLGNFYTLRDLLSQGYTGREVRYMLLHVHYRTQLNFTLAGLKGARSALLRLEEFISRLRSIKDPLSHHLVEPLLAKCRDLFAEALKDDLNISVALGSLFDLVREVNTLIDVKKIGKIEADSLLNFLEKIDEVLGVLPLEVKEERLDPELVALLEEREKARSAKEWKKADGYRDLLLQKGYSIEDTPSGARLKKEKIHG